MSVITFWENNTFPDGAPESAMCDGFILDDISTGTWYFNPPPGIYKNAGICATENVPAYSSPVIVPYEVYNIDASSSLPIFSEEPYFGSARFIITSPGSGDLRVTASAESDNIPFGRSTRLYAAIGGGTGPDFTFSWTPGDSLDSPNAQNPNASPTVTTEYTVTVTDSAGAIAIGRVKVTVSLGAFVSASPSTINFGQTSQLNVTAGGGTQPYKYTYKTQDGTILAELIDDPFLTVSPSVTTNYIVTVTDNNGNGDTVAANVTVTVGPPPELQIIKFSNPDTVRAGDAFQYHIIVKNIGQGAATDVILRDPLPPEVTLNLPLPFGCIGVDSELTCALGDLVPDESAGVTIDATVNSGVSGPIVNTAYARSNETDEFSDTWRSNVCPETVTNCFDLSIVKNADPLVALGDNVRYGLSVANLGPDVAADVRITDTLPPGFDFDPFNSSSRCSANGSTVTCSLGTYFTGDSELIIIEATVTSQASLGTNVNTATVFNNVGPDPIPGNNSDDADTFVVQQPGALEIEKTTRFNTVNVIRGDPIEFIITVFNNGTSDATGVTVRDILPEHLIFNPGFSSPGCSVSGGVVTCDPVTLPSNQGRNEFIRADVSQCAQAGTITNTATVSGDFFPIVNSSSYDIVVDVPPPVGNADLAVTLSSLFDPVLPGGFLGYNVEVRNIGPAIANGVSVTGALPPNVSFEPDFSPGCSESNGTVTCCIGSIGVNTVGNASIGMNVNPDAPTGTITFTIDAQGDEPDPDPTNNSASVDVTIQ